MTRRKFSAEERRKFSAEEKIRIVLEGLRGEEGIAELCRRARNPSGNAHNSEASDARKPTPPIFLKAGTRLVREWRGVTYTVLVHADGFEWNGRRYRSLTIVAREITAHWSVPRFFGLKNRAGRSVESAEGDHAEA